nr:hypothetical protein [Escherichia coli]
MRILVFIGVHRTVYCAQVKRLFMYKELNYEAGNQPDVAPE